MATATENVLYARNKVGIWVYYTETHNETDAWEIAKTMALKGIAVAVVSGYVGPTYNP